MNKQKMNRNTAVIAAATALLIAGSMAFGLAIGTNPSDGMKVTGWVKVQVVREGNVIYFSENHNLITTAGKDYISAQIGSTSPAGNGANYIGLSLDSQAPSASDTALAGEIATGGLARALGTYSHTAGQNTFTVTKQFTASGTFTGVQKAGLFTASTAGTMMAENTFSSVNLVSGDQITITWTITIA